jgi:hypothetical protein
MAARYALESFIFQQASGTAIHIEAGSLRDSVTSPVAVAAPGMFGTVAPVAGVGHISARLAQHLAAYPQGAEVS